MGEIGPAAELAGKLDFLRYNLFSLFQLGPLAFTVSRPYIRLTAHPWSNKMHRIAVQVPGPPKGTCRKKGVLWNV
jgi:hypothetical protein